MSLIVSSRATDEGPTTKRQDSIIEIKKKIMIINKIKKIDDGQEKGRDKENRRPGD